MAIFVGNDIASRRVQYHPPRAFTLVPPRIRLPRSWSSLEFKAALFYPVTDFAIRHSHLAKLAWSSTELLRIRVGLRRGSYLKALKIDSTAVDLDQPNRVLLGAMRREGLEAVDALAPLRAAYRRGVQVYGNMDRHLSPEGHQVLEQLLEPTVMAHLRGLPPTGVVR